MRYLDLDECVKECACKLIPFESSVWLPIEFPFLVVLQGTSTERERSVSSVAQC